MTENSEPRIYYDPRAIDWFINNVLCKKKYYDCSVFINDCCKILDLAQNYWFFEWEEPEDINNRITYADSSLKEVFLPKEK